LINKKTWYSNHGLKENVKVSNTLTSTTEEQKFRYWHSKEWSVEDEQSKWAKIGAYRSRRLLPEKFIPLNPL